MLGMLTRRDFAGLLAASLGSPLLADHASGQQPRPQSHVANPQTSAPKTSVMMWTLNKSGTFEQNLERVAQAGYTQVELVNEYMRWSDADTARILGRMSALGVTVDAMAGMTLGFADPAGGDAFLAELKTLIPIAHRLGCNCIILLSGARIAKLSVANPNAGSETEAEDSAAQRAQHLASIQTLKRAAEVLSPAGLVGVIEPIDRLENPTIYLDGVSEAFDLVKAVDSPAIRVLYDLYHEQRSHGNLIEKLEANIGLVGLIHVADVPGRHEPGSGEVDYVNIYRALARLEYDRTIAMEFYPTGDIVQTLRTAREQVGHSFKPQF